ncbi:hypothetical protein MMC07_006099 [Pseudocyphellaria aurata]|nr:hypothetical protein [Pseudocyphellaria aurata]
MFLHPEPPRKEIRSQLDLIYKRKNSDQRTRQISDIAKKKSRDFITNLRGAHREDDLVELIHEAFRELYPYEVFDCPRKADWNQSLKPDFQQEVWDPNALGQVHTVDNIVDRPSKQRHGDQSIPTPDASRSSMLPPTAPSPVALPQSRQDGAV